MNDMTQGPIWRKLFPFALPIIFSMVTQQLYNLVDAVIVGRFLGSAQLGAVGNAGSIVMVTAAISGGIELGTQVVFSRFVGKKDFARVGRNTAGILGFTAISGLALGLVGILFGDYIITAIGVPELMAADAKIYMQIYFAGMAGIYVFDVSRSVLLAFGKSGSTLVMVICSTVLNIILDLLFICVFKMGVAGAALATILAQIIGMFISLAGLRSCFKKFGIRLRFAADSIKDTIYVLKIAVPNMAQQFAITLAVILLQSCVNGFGEQVISGYTVVSKLQTLFMLPIAGLAQSMSVFAAQNIGGEKITRVRKSYGVALLACTSYALLLSVAVFMLPRQIASVFLDIEKNPDAYGFICLFLQMSVPAYLIAAWRYVSEGYLRGCEKMNAYLLSSVTGLVTRVVLTFALAAPLGRDCFWIAYLSGMLLPAVLSFILVQKSSFAIVKGQFTKTPDSAK